MDVNSVGVLLLVIWGSTVQDNVGGLGKLAVVGIFRRTTVEKRRPKPLIICSRHHCHVERALIWFPDLDPPTGIAKGTNQVFDAVL